MDECNRTRAAKQLLSGITAAASLFAAATPARADVTYKAPGSDTTLYVRGYVKADAIWSNHSTGVDSTGDQLLQPGTIPVGPSAGAHKNNQVTFHARQSRLGLGTSTPTEYGDVTTYVEGDFFGADGNESSTNSHGFRLRHAYGSLGKLLAGQTWTNFFDEQAYIETLDFGGPTGEIFVRQAQFRWTEKYSSGDWSLSAESPESVIAVPGSATPFRSDSDHAPDFTARVRHNVGRAVYSASALARNIHVDSAALGADSGRWGGALAFSGIVPVGGRDDLRFDVNAGNAIGRYQMGAFFPDGYLDASGKLQLAAREPHLEPGRRGQRRLGIHPCTAHGSRRRPRHAEPHPVFRAIQLLNPGEMP
jgi:hypothetical protein